MDTSGASSPEDRFRNAETLRSIIRTGSVKFLRASWLVEHAEKGTLRLSNRTTLEQNHPDAFADNSMVERALAEVEQGAKKSWSVYPALVLVSFCWQTAEHPDPGGSLLRMLSVYLNWYAAQRTMYTRDRLYWGDSMQGEGFESDFCVMLDFWSLHQQPRSAEQEESFAHARKSMHVLLAHRATTVMCLSDLPQDFKAHPEFVKRGGYLGRGWCFYEKALGAMCKVQGQCLDMAGFETMLSRMDESGVKRQALSTPFPRMTEEELRNAALDDCNGTVDGASCLCSMVKGMQMPLMPPADMAALLLTKGFDEEADLGVCGAGYSDAASTILGGQTKMSVVGMTHWQGPQLTQVGGALSLCTCLTDLWIRDCSLGDDGLEALAQGLLPGCAPQLALLSLAGNGIGQRGCVALAAALGRGALPGLRMVGGVTGEVDDPKAVAAAAGAGVQVTYSGETLTVLREAPASVLSLTGVDVDRDNLIPQPPAVSSTSSVLAMASRTGPDHSAPAANAVREVAPSDVPVNLTVPMSGPAGDVSAGMDLLRPEAKATSSPLSASGAAQPAATDRPIGAGAASQHAAADAGEQGGPCQCCAIS